MPTRSKIAPGSQVTYVGPHVEGYLPALNVGLVEHVGPARSRVRYPWGCHSILTDRLAAVKPGRCQQTSEELDRPKGPGPNQTQRPEGQLTSQAFMIAIVAGAFLVFGEFADLFGLPRIFPKL